MNRIFVLSYFTWSIFGMMTSDLYAAKKSRAQSCSAGLNDAVYHRIPDPMKFHFSKEVSVLGMSSIDALVTPTAYSLLNSVSANEKVRVVVLLENTSTNIVDKVSANDVLERLSQFGMSPRDVRVLDAQLRAIPSRDLAGTRLSRGDTLAVRLNVRARALALMLFRQNFKRPEVGDGELLDHLIVVRVSTETQLIDKISSNRRWSSRIRFSIGLDDVPFGFRSTPGVPRLRLPNQSLTPIERTKRIRKVQEGVARFLTFHGVISAALVEAVAVRTKFVSFDETTQQIWVESTLPTDGVMRMIHLPSIHRIVSIPEPQSRAD